MAQTGYTPIQLYYSTTGSAVPTSGNLASGELAINIADGKLYYKNSGGTVKQIAATTTGTNAQLLANDGSGGFSNVTVGSGLSYSGGTLSASGGGTVTTVSVVSANGLAGTVANATTTPAITLSTSITGVLKGNGTAISAAVSGTDYAPATSGTSILYGNGSGGFSNVTIGSGLSFAGGTLSGSSTTSIGLVRAIAINCILP